MPDIDQNIWVPYQDEDVLVFGLHTDEPDLLLDFVEQTGITFPLARDIGTRQLLSFPPGVGYPYPRDVIIDKDGVVRSIKNSFDVNEATALVQELLAE